MIRYPYMVISDVHFHAFSFGSYINAEGINSRLQQTIDEFERAAEVLRKQGGKDIIITGDLFHERGSIKPKVFNPVHAMFVRLSEKGHQVWAIPGNHDLETEVADVDGNCFSSFESIPGWKIFYRAEIWPMEDNKIAAFLPWNEAGIDHYLDVIGLGQKNGSTKNIETIFCHVGLSNVVTGVKSTTDADQFLKVKGLKYAFAGHFHNFKRFDLNDGFQQSTVFSVGASGHQSFKDVGSQAGFLIVNKEGVTHHKSQAPAFVDYTDDDFLHPEIFDPHKFIGNFVRINMKDGVRTEEVVAIKTTLQAIGALKVISTAVIDNGLDAVIDGSDAFKTIIGDKNESVKTQLASYINMKYEKALAEKMTHVIDKEGIDER